MGRQAVLADARVIHQAALHHVPAHRALQAAEQKDPRHRQYQVPWYASARQEIEKRHEKDHADAAAEQAMHVLPPEDGLEFRKTHVVIDLLVFGRLLVFLEDLVPLLRIEWRQRSHQRLPFDDGQSRMSQPRNPANDQGCEHHGTADEQPGGDLFTGGCVHTGRSKQGRQRRNSNCFGPFGG